MAAKSTTKQTKPLAEQTPEELQATLMTKQADLLDYKKGLATGELQNPRIIGKTRKEIARLKTALTMHTLSKEGEK